MANLTRYKQKIFANNSNQVGVFGTGTDKVASKNVETLQSSDYEDGWSSAIITSKNYPVWQERDGVDYGFSYQLAYLLQKGIPDWLSTETYYTNDFCKMGNTIYYSLQDNNIGKNPITESTYWEEFSSGNSRNIGEIVASTIPLTDAGLHLLDGSLLQYGSYQAFIDYIADLYDSGDYSAIFDTEANWQSSVTTYGVCGKFVYDSVNNTVRLPKITGIVEGTTDVTALGDLIEAGLPNITGSIKLSPADSYNSDFTGCFTGSDSAWSASLNSGVYHYSRGNFDASRSSSIYGNSSTVQPQSVKVLYYIVIATTTKTDIQVDIDEIATDLNGKADVDLTNVDNSGNILMAKASMPSATYDNLTLGASGTEYTAPADGWISFVKQATGNQYFQFTNQTANWFNNVNGSNGQYISILCPVKKSDVFKIAYDLGGGTAQFRFIYAQGSESEAG